MQVNDSVSQDWVLTEPCTFWRTGVGKGPLNTSVKHISWRDAQLPAVKMPQTQSSKEEQAKYEHIYAAARNAAAVTATCPTAGASQRSRRVTS